MRFSYASPVVLDGRVYVLDDSILKCAAAASGEIDWQLRLAGPFSGTPVIAGEHLYAVNEDGRLHTVLCGENGEVVATSELGEAILCTPAVAAGALFVRSDGSLWKIAGS
jgi:outer membrane protein assembly factor BamB